MRQILKKDWHTSIEASASLLRSGSMQPKSIHQCIDQGILREFLEKNGSEVRNMVLTEWDENEARRVAAEEARENARPGVSPLKKPGKRS